MIMIYALARIIASVLLVSLIFPLIPGIAFNGGFVSAVVLGLIYWVVVFELCFELPSLIGERDFWLGGLFGFILLPTVAVLLIGNASSDFVVTGSIWVLATTTAALAMQGVIELTVKVLQS